MGIALKGIAAKKQKAQKFGTIKKRPGMPDQESFSLGAVVLAAGASSRMGSPKMLLPWGETTILGHLIALWTRLGANQIAVVRAPGLPPVVSELRRLQFSPENEVINPEPDRGMFSSIQQAAQWNGWSQGLTHWAILLGDQPHLKGESLEALLRFAKANPMLICQPGRHGRARHPVIVPRLVFETVAESKAETLRQFLLDSKCERRMIEIDDPGLAFDIDTPADYDRARRSVFGE
jgi:molybdenum cofactor cytidylyltransferase